MRQGRNFSLRLLAAVVIGSVCVLGCASAGQPVAEPAAQEVDEQAPAAEAPSPAASEKAAAMLSEAEQAYANEDYEAARDVLSALLEEPEGLTEEQVGDARSRLGRVESILHQRTLEAQETAQAQAEAAEQATEDPAPVPEDPEAALQRAVGLLAAAEQLAAEEKWADLVPKLEALDALRGYLSLEDRALYDILRAIAAAESEDLSELPRREKVTRAEEHLGAGLAAFKASDYPTASRHLGASAALDVSMGWWDNRKLRTTRSAVDETLAGIQADLEEGRQLNAEEQYEQARALLADVLNRRVAVGIEDNTTLEKLVAQVDGELARRKLEQIEQQRNLAGGLLAQAQEKVAAQDYEGANATLTELGALADYLSEQQGQQFDRLCAAVEQAIGVAPTMSAEDMLVRAREYLQAGVAAQEEGRYADAQAALARAERLGTDLSRKESRKLQKVKTTVDETLARLLADCARGKELYGAGRLEEARQALMAVAESGVNIGQQQTEEVVRLLAEIEQKQAAEQQRVEQERRNAAAALLAQAGSLAQEGKYAEASAKLDGLAEVTQYLSAEQAVQADDLRKSIATAAEAEAVETRLARAQALADQAADLLAAQDGVREGMEAAAGAMRAEDFERAKALLVEVRDSLKGLDAEAAPTFKEAAIQVQQKLKAVEAAIARRARIADVEQQVASRMGEAQRLLAVDLLAAEKKVLEAAELAEQQGVGLADEQLQVRHAVLAAVEARYGAERRLRPEIYRQLVGFADAYSQAAQYERAVQVLTLVKEAPAGMVVDGYRHLAMGNLAAARHDVAQQAESAKGYMARLAQTKGVVSRGALPEALARAEALAVAATEAGLGDQRLAAVLEAVVTLLQEDLEQAVPRVYLPLEQAVEAALSDARAVVALRLSQFYLNSGGPELAEPYLKQLAEATGVEKDWADWARMQLSTVPARTAEAGRARVLAVAADTERVLALAETLHDLAQKGRVAEAKAVEQDLADARLALQVKMAEAALGRGAYTEAARLLGEAPLDKAGQEALANVYGPVEARLARLRRLVAILQAAEEAIEAQDLQTAVEKLKAAEEATVTVEPLAIKREALGGALDRVLETREAEMALRVQKERTVQALQAQIAALTARQAAWEGYRAALTAFLTGQEDAATSLSAAMGSAQLLQPSELAGVREMAAALAVGRGASVLAEAEAKLQEAEAAYQLADYVRAAALLADAQAMPGFALTEALAERTGRLSQAIQEREREARALYAQAVEAYEAQDAERVRRLTGELRAKYRNTKAYAEHQ